MARKAAPARPFDDHLSERALFQDKPMGFDCCVRLALLTNAWSDARSLLTDRFLLSQLVDEMVISAEVGLAKPDPAIYHLTLNRLGVGPQEALFVDNKLRNTAAAEALGIPAIIFHTSTQAIAAVERYLEAG